LVSEEDFVKAQAVTAVATPADGRTRRYLLTGLVVCDVCGRRADGHWVHDRPGYRCRHGRTSARPATPGRLKTVYWREDELLTRAGRRLANNLPANADHRVTATYLRARKTRDRL
jgi:site-specific DNA recombinase